MMIVAWTVPPPWALIAFTRVFRVVADGVIVIAVPFTVSVREESEEIPWVDGSVTAVAPALLIAVEYDPRFVTEME